MTLVINLIYKKSRKKLKPNIELKGRELSMFHLDSKLHKNKFLYCPQKSCSTLKEEKLVLENIQSDSNEMIQLRK